MVHVRRSNDSLVESTLSFFLCSGLGIQLRLPFAHEAILLGLL